MPVLQVQPGAAGDFPSRLRSNQAWTVGYYSLLPWESVRGYLGWVLSPIRRPLASVECLALYSPTPHLFLHFPNNVTAWAMSQFNLPPLLSGSRASSLIWQSQGPISPLVLRQGCPSLYPNSSCLLFFLSGLAWKTRQHFSESLFQESRSSFVRAIANECWAVGLGLYSVVIGNTNRVSANG